MTKKRTIVKKRFSFSWQWVPVVGGILAILFGILKWNEGIAKTDQVKESLNHLETMVVQTLEKFQDKMDYKIQRDRLDNLKDQEIKLKTQQRSMPTNAEIKEDLEEVKKEKIKVEEKIKELEKK